MSSIDFEKEEAKYNQLIVAKEEATKKKELAKAQRTLRFNFHEKRQKPSKDDLSKTSKIETETSKDIKEEKDTSANSFELKKPLDNDIKKDDSQKAKKPTRTFKKKIIAILLIIAFFVAGIFSFKTFAPDHYDYFKYGYVVKDSHEKYLGLRDLEFQDAKTKADELFKDHLMELYNICNYDEFLKFFDDGQKYSSLFIVEDNGRYVFADDDLQTAFEDSLYKVAAGTAKSIDELKNQSQYLNI